MPQQAECGRQAPRSNGCRVGERLFGGEGNIILRMRASQVPFPASVADVQVAPAKDRGLGQHFALLESRSQKKRLENRPWRMALLHRLHHRQLASALYIHHHANRRSTAQRRAESCLRSRLCCQCQLR